MNSLFHCAKCFGPVIPVTYGLPTEEAVNDPNFYSGGCMIEIGQEDKYFCRNCNQELGMNEVIFGR
jgi:hypothetical protein